jgi:uncharacterized protein YukE
VVETVQAMAKQFGDFAHDVESAFGSLNSFGADTNALAWIGQTAEAFKSQFGPVPGRLQKLYISYSEASDALSAYAPALQSAQSKADAALRQAQDADVDLQRAQSTANNAAADLKTAQQNHAANPNPQAVADAQTAHDTAQTGVKNAQDRMDALKKQAQQAAHDLDDAANACAKALHHAQHDGIHNKHWWQHVGAELAKWGGKIGEIAGEIAPVLDVLAIATSWIPGVDVVTAGLAEADNLIALGGTGLQIAGDGMQGHWGDAMMGAGMLGAQVFGGRALGALGGKVLGRVGAEAEESGANAVSKDVRGEVSDDVRAAPGAVSEDVPGAAPHEVPGEVSDADPALVAALKANDFNYERDLDFTKNLVATDSRFAGMNPEELAAVRGYTGSDVYGPMNAALRDGDPAELAKWDAHIKATDAGLAQLPEYVGVVKRGVDLPASVLDDIQPGQTTAFKEFLSGSATRPFPGNTQFTISSLTGKDIQALSQVPGEAEVLFRPGTTYDVISKVQDAAGTWHITMSEAR